MSKALKQNDRSKKGPRECRNLNVIKVDVPRRPTKIGRPDTFFEPPRISKKKRGLCLNESLSAATSLPQVRVVASKRRKFNIEGGAAVPQGCDKFLNLGGTPTCQVCQFQPANFLAPTCQLFSPNLPTYHPCNLN